MESFKERLNKERLNWEKRKCSKDYYLKDSDIDAVVESISDLAIMLMFNEDIVRIFGKNIKIRFSTSSEHALCL